MRIKVTQEDIDKGKRYNLSECPVALALSRAYGVGATVSARLLRFGGYSCSPSPALRAFIRRFDNGEPVKPLAFTLPDDGPVVSVGTDPPVSVNPPALDEPPLRNEARENGKENPMHPEP